MSDSEFKIEKGEPPPPKGRAATSKYPWDDLRPGYYFSVPGGESIEQTQTRLINAANHRARTTGEKFATRQVNGEVRVYRTE